MSKKKWRFKTYEEKAKELGVNYSEQKYRGIILRCIPRKDYCVTKAKRFTINGTNQNIWIPNKHLTDDGTIKPYENIDYVLCHSKSQLQHAGVNMQEMWKNNRS